MRDRPAARMEASSSPMTQAGAIRPASASNRSQTACAAFTEICWPTMERASVEKASPLVRRFASGCARMILRSTLSFFARCPLASSQ